jgi:RsiW-degrading membrane proteinase PrsW (M82 family)
MPQQKRSDEDESPFRPPAIPAANDANTADPSVFAEPWMKFAAYQGDVNDSPVVDTNAFIRPEVDHSVWDEPGLSRSLSGEAPDHAVTWFIYFTQMKESTTAITSWLITILIAIIGGPLAILGTLIEGTTQSGLLTVIAIRPTIEEIMKVALPLWIVEKRPWLFRSSTQILICCFASGLAFAAVENLIYLRFYVPNPSITLAQWRWTICVLLHSSCSLLAGFGVMRMWQSFQAEKTAPQVSHAGTALLSAIILHGSYNAFATLLETIGFAF